MGLFETELKTWVLNGLILVTAVITFLIDLFLIFFALNRGAKRTGSIVDASLVRNNFLITRQVRDCLSVWYITGHKGRSVLAL